MEPKLDELASFLNQTGLGFAMSYGDVMCIDGHYTPEELLKLAKAIQKIIRGK